MQGNCILLLSAQKGSGGKKLATATREMRGMSNLTREPCLLQNCSAALIYALSRCTWCYVCGRAAKKYFCTYAREGASLIFVTAMKGHEIFKWWVLLCQRHAANIMMMLHELGQLVFSNSHCRLLKIHSPAETHKPSLQMFI